MKRAIGFIELNSIAKGVETADIVLKTAAVRLLFSKASCPGKYYIFFTGDVAAVQASVDSGLVIAGDHAVDSCVIPNIDEKVVQAVNMTNIPEEMAAIGVMEYFSVTASVYSADAAVKAADVDLAVSSIPLIWLVSMVMEAPLARWITVVGFITCLPRPSPSP